MDVPDTYYQRNKERCKARAMAYYQANKEHYQEYNRKYYQETRKMDMPPQPEKGKKAPVAKPAKPPKPLLPIPERARRSAPRDYFVYEKEKGPLESELSSYNLKPHQVKKMMEICPKGILTTPQPENPFLITWK